MAQMMVLRLLFLFAACGLASCSLAPPYQPPHTEVATEYQTSQSWKLATPHDAQSRGRWWERFHDSTLNALESHMTDANQDLQSAFARLQEARAETRIAGSAQYADVTTNASASRNRASLDSPTYVTSQPIRYDNFIAGVALSYEVDLFGRLRNTVLAARAEEQATAGDVAALDLTLRADMADDYFLLRALDAEQALLDHTVADYQKALNITTAMFHGGTAANADVQQATAQLESTKTRAEDAKLRRVQTEHAIATLVGQQASQFQQPFLPLPDVLALPPIDAGLPSELLERRPDIAAAERRVAAANARIGIARAAYFPVFSLAAAAGMESFSLSNMMLLPSHYWSIGPQSVLSVFDGGRRRAQSAAMHAAYDEQIADYRNRVLRAFQEVEDNLAALRQLNRESISQAAAVVAAQGALDQADHRYRSGLVTYLEVVSTENAALAARLTAVDIQARQLVATVLLIKALGGDWGEQTLQRRE
jgi:NodT family efflux transporter outer membrane factor (OMF) lipoprotein